jgi:UDP-2,4-diacetamido-2,4,6-trideoxy-beta-L-altropyranose hydrolase
MTAASAPRVLFAPAVGAVGGGHLVRCAALALALAERGAEIAFTLPPEAGGLLDRVAPGLHAEILDPPREDAAQAHAPDILVLDDYSLDAERERFCRPAARVLAVVDDLADRRHLCDVLIDPSYARRAGDYDGLVPQDCEVLAGPGFALLRPAFARLRPSQPRTRDGPPGRVFVAFGLADPGGITAKAVERLRPLAPDAQFDIALGASAASLPRLRALAAEDPGLRLYVESADVAALMAEADVAVGAGGGGVWERCCLGLPSLVVAVADNQRPMLRALSGHGVVIGVDVAEPEWAARLETSFKVLVDPIVSKGLSQASMALCDGAGAGRAADALLARLSRG